LILGNIAMKGALETRRVDSILVRLFMQWMAVSAVVAQIDLSHVEVYGWSKSRMEVSLTSQLADESEENHGNSHGSAKASGADFLFQCPSWFKQFMGHVVFFSGSIPSPSPITSQEALECLVDRYIGDAGVATNMPSKAKTLYPAIWWLCFPLVVIIYLIALILLVAKVVYPIYRYKKRSSSVDDGIVRGSVEERYVDDKGRLGDYKIFGLARSTLSRHIVVDAAPIVWIVCIVIPHFPPLVLCIPRLAYFILHRLEVCGLAQKTSQYQRWRAFIYCFRFVCVCVCVCCQE